MTMSIMICQAIAISKHKNQHLLQANNDVIFDNKATYLMLFTWATTITDSSAKNFNDNARWVDHNFLCSNINIWLSQLWPSHQDNLVHVDCSVSWTSKTNQKYKCLQKLYVGTHSPRSLWSKIHGSTDARKAKLGINSQLKEDLCQCANSH